MSTKPLGSRVAAFLTMLWIAFFASAALAELKVAVMPSGTSAPPNAWDSRPYTWPGNELELWGRVISYTGGLPLKYKWEFGAGEGEAGGDVTDARNIAALHTYGATGSKIARLTVFEDPDAGGTLSASASVFIDIVPKTLAVEKALTVQRALKKLYMGAWEGGGCDGNPGLYWDQTGLAVLSFEDYNHRASNNLDQDIYAETVKRGLSTIEAGLGSAIASNTPNTDSDINGNGRKVFDASAGGELYQMGILAMAIANTKEPSRIVQCGPLAGDNYKTILEDVVDYIAYAQEDRQGTGCASWVGGWRYYADYCSSDNSAAQWPVLGLAAAAQAPWAISPPAFVKALLPNWLANSQNPNGAFGYTSPWEWLNVAKTGAGVIQLSYAGLGATPAMTNALTFLGDNWCVPYNYDGNLSDHYAMYAVKKGLQYAGLSTVNAACRGGPVSWQDEYDRWLVDNQVNDGTNGVYWYDSGWAWGQHNTTSFSLLIMAQGLAETPPSAEAGVNQEVPPNTNVVFDGSASKHNDPARSILKYEWDIDYDGVTFDVNLVGAKPTLLGGYTLPPGVAEKVFTVALRVTDDNVPPLTASDTTTVKVSLHNQAPVANAGGPYLGAVGSNITLNGGGSSDANSAGGSNPIANSNMPSGYDEIVSYEWDLDGDGTFGDAVGKNPTINFGAFIGTKTISLKVTDSFGLSGVQSSSATTVAVSNVQPLCYVSTVNSYNPIRRVWTRGWKLKLQNVGTGAAGQISAVLTSIPPGVTVVDGSLSWSGDIGPGGELLSSDDFRYQHGSPAPDVAAMTWDITLTDALGQKHVVRQVPQGAGICQ